MDRLYGGFPAPLPHSDNFMPTCRPKSQEDGARPFLDSQSSVMNTAMPLDLRTKGIRRGSGPQPQAKRSAAGGSYSLVLVLVK